MAMETICELHEHHDRVWCVEWSPSGKALASCGGDKDIRIWVEDHTNHSYVNKCVLSGVHTRTVRCVAWSPTGELLASCGFDGIVGIWENTNGEFECITTLEGHENEVKSVAWSASGLLLATCSRDKSVWIWELDEHKEFETVAVLHGHKGDVKSVHWHPTEDLLFSASYDDTIRVWEEHGQEWECIDTLAEHKSTVWKLAFNPKGDRMVSVSDDQTCIVWKSVEREDKTTTTTRTWVKETHVSDTHTRTIYGVDWSLDGHFIVTSAGDNAICILDATQQQMKMIHKQENAHDGDVNCVVFHPSRSCIASASDDGRVRLWSVKINQT